jgi:rsbT co-antagonist protein RsbR
VFVLAFKRPLFALVQRQLAGDADTQMAAVWTVSALVDRMAQWTIATYQQTREDIIKRQQQDLLELSTPVIKLFDGVLAVPMIGTLDSSRTQVVMETLLERIVETGSRLAIIDITGVPTVDTLVAQRHPAADRADHRAPGHRPAGHRLQVQPRRRAADGAGAAGLHHHARAVGGP